MYDIHNIFIGGIFMRNAFHKRITSLLLVIALLVTSINVFASTPPATGKSDKKYLVEFKSEIEKAKFVNESTKSKKVKKTFTSQPVIAVELTEQEAAQLAGSTDVLTIEPDASVEILSVDKPNKADQSVKKMKKNTQTMPWGVTNIGTTQTLKKFTGKKVKVAIFDTGVSAHEDLAVSGGVSLVDYTTAY